MTFRGALRCGGEWLLRQEGRDHGTEALEVAGADRADAHLPALRTLGEAVRAQELVQGVILELRPPGHLPLVALEASVEQEVVLPVLVTTEGRTRELDLDAGAVQLPLDRDDAVDVRPVGVGYLGDREAAVPPHNVAMDTGVRVLVEHDRLSAFVAARDHLSSHQAHHSLFGRGGQDLQELVCAQGCLGHAICVFLPIRVRGHGVSSAAEPP